LSLQDKIAKSQIQARLKLRDYKISQIGIESVVVRLKVEENIYGDETVEIIDSDKITVNLIFPDDLPYTRLREDVTSAVAQPEALYFYDVLPIEGFAAHEDNVEKGDILIHIIHDGRSAKDLYLVLRVSELLGTVQAGYITGRKFNCSPHNMPLPEEVQSIVESYGDEI